MEVDADHLGLDSKRGGVATLAGRDLSHRDSRESAPTAGRAGVHRRLQAVLIFYWLGIFVASHIKLHDAVSVFRIRDKVLHFAAYAGLTFLATLYYRLRKGSIGWIEMAVIWTLAASYGVFDEITQIPVGRTADPLDWVADAAGAATGLVAFMLIRRFSGELKVERGELRVES